MSGVLARALKVNQMIPYEWLSTVTGAAIVLIRGSEALISGHFPFIKTLIKHVWYFMKNSTSLASEKGRRLEHHQVLPELGKGYSNVN